MISSDRYVLVRMKSFYDCLAERLEDHYIRMWNKTNDWISNLFPRHYIGRRRVKITDQITAVVYRRRERILKDRWLGIFNCNRLIDRCVSYVGWSRQRFLSNLTRTKFILILTFRFISSNGTIKSLMTWRRVQHLETNAESSYRHLVVGI